MSSEQRNRVFIGGISERVQKEDIEKELSRFGRLNSVWVAQNPPGFAFVEFEDITEAEMAVAELNGKPFLDSMNNIRVEHSHGGGGRSRRGGGGRGSDRSYGNDRGSDRSYGRSGPGRYDSGGGGYRNGGSGNGGGFGGGGYRREGGFNRGGSNFNGGGYNSGGYQDKGRSFGGFGGSGGRPYRDDRGGYERRSRSPPMGHSRRMDYGDPSPGDYGDY